MALQTLLEIREILKKRQVILFFNGPFSQGIVREISQALQEYISSDMNIKFKNKTRTVFSTFIEQIQNIKKYCEAKKESEYYDEIRYSGLITIQTDGNNVYISSGNYVESKDVEPLVASLEKIRFLDKEKIKTLYSEECRKDIDESSTGGGLGFLEMAKISSQPLNYWVRDRDDELFGKLNYFLIEVVIEGGA